MFHEIIDLNGDLKKKKKRTSLCFLMTRTRDVMFSVSLTELAVYSHE